MLQNYIGEDKTFNTFLIILVKWDIAGVEYSGVESIVVKKCSIHVHLGDVQHFSTSIYHPIISAFSTSSVYGIWCRNNNWDVVVL